MILRLAERMGMAVIRSTQKHGAKLEREPDLLQRVQATKKEVVWIVEMPGPELEAALCAQGLEVKVIDHHTYGLLNRAVNPVTGAPNPSSLEQFMEMATITDDELVTWGYNPKTVRGIGIFDDRFAQGLRDAGYTLSEITSVLDLGTEFSRALNPDLAEIQEAAKNDWAKREMWNGYILVRSEYPKDVRGAIGHLSIRAGSDTTPLIVSACGGRKIYVHEVSPKALARLQRLPIPPEQTFTFGGTRCWGYDSSKSSKSVIPLDHILNALKEPKTTP